MKRLVDNLAVRTVYGPKSAIPLFFEHFIPAFRNRTCMSLFESFGLDTGLSEYAFELCDDRPSWELVQVVLAVGTGEGFLTIRACVLLAGKLFFCLDRVIYMLTGFSDTHTG
jgi:hypothetical protein